MDFRTKPRSAALLALGTLALASALLAGGCAAPKNSEKARFGLVSGTVTDAQGNPVVGARVTVIDQATPTSIGTRNYFGPRGPFITNASGRFTITGVLAAPNDVVVLNFRVEKDGFLPSIAAHTVAEETAVPGTTRVLPAGAVTSDIVVNATAITDVSATLAMQAPAVQVSASGATVQTQVPPVQTTSSGGAPVVLPAATASIQIPAGAVQATTPISITPVTTSAASAPVTIAAQSPSNVVAPGATVIAGVSAGAVNLQPEGLVFPPEARPTVRMPLLFSTDDIPAGTHLPINWFNSSTGLWEHIVDAVVEAENGRAVAVFQVSHFSTYQVEIPVEWDFGSLKFTVGDQQTGTITASDLERSAKVFGTDLTSLPVTYSPTLFYNSPNLISTGTVYNNALQNSLQFGSSTEAQRQFLTSSFEQIAEAGTAFAWLDVNVPAGDGSFAVGLQASYPFTATVQLSKVAAGVKDQKFAGTRVYWSVPTSDQALGSDLKKLLKPIVPPDTTVITHPQGGGIDF